MVFRLALLFSLLFFLSEPNAFSSDEEGKVRKGCIQTLFEELGEMLGWETNRNMGAEISTDKSMGPIKIVSKSAKVESSSVTKVKVKEKDPPQITKWNEREQLKEMLSKNDRGSTVLLDFIQYRWLEKLNRRFGAASILLGSEPNDKDSELIEEVSKRGFLVLYDADKMGKYFAKNIENPFAIGISSRFQNFTPGHLVLRIQNPYVRQKVHSISDVRIVSGDSLEGIGLQLRNKANFIWCPNGEGHLDLNHWRDSLSNHLGVEPFRYMSRLKDSKEFKERPYFSVKGERPPTFNEIDFIDSLYEDEIRNTLKIAQELLDGEKKLNYRNGRVFPGGAVIFGSSSFSKPHIDLVYQSAKLLAQRRIPVTTGGSLGLMAVANQGAYDAGGESIGIPMFGLWKEKSSADLAHTLTVYTNGYETRIPLLLNRKRLILFAPGGGGTIRELAILFSMISEFNGKRIPDIVFLGKRYYENLVGQLRDLRLPERVLSRIHLINSVKELKPIIDDIETYLDKKGFDFFLKEDPTPRNDETSYILPEKEEKSSWFF